MLKINLIKNIMGCSSATEDLETKLLMLKIKRVAIQQERNKKIKKLEKLTGEEVIRESIPDYLEESDDNISENGEDTKKLGKKEKEYIFKRRANNVDYNHEDKKDKEK